MGATTPAPGTHSGARPTVAVVDDDAGVCRALERLLTSTGYAVSTYTSAEEFLAAGHAADVDCLVLDVYLGAMTGIELHAALLAAGAAPPTVFVTAHAESVGELPCLRKPFEADTFLDTIAALLDPPSA
jgi:FixJ family two-component response regulator